MMQDWQKQILEKEGFAKKRAFKKHPVTINALQFFVQYLGAEVEGNCKWHITSIDIPNIDSEIDTLWHTKEEAIQAIQEFIA